MFIEDRNWCMSLLTVVRDCVVGEKIYPKISQTSLHNSSTSVIFFHEEFEILRNRRKLMSHFQDRQIVLFYGFHSCLAFPEMSFHLHTSENMLFNVRKHIFLCTALSKHRLIKRFKFLVQLKYTHQTLLLL